MCGWKGVPVGPNKKKVIGCPELPALTLLRIIKNYTIIQPSTKNNKNAVKSDVKTGRI